MQALGSELPSQVKTVTVIVRVVVDWSGKERYIKGSKVTEILLQIGQTRVDLYWPCKYKFRVWTELAISKNKGHKQLK